jgi:uncharacterized protein YjbI with pentapeptide repeats
LEKAICRASKFARCNLEYADLSHADLTAADFSSSHLNQANLHRIIEEGTIWSGSNKDKALPEDKELAEAEDWQPAGKR